MHPRAEKRSLLSLAALRELLLEESAKLRRMLEVASAANSLEASLALKSWILLIENLAGRLNAVISYAERGLWAAAQLEACAALDTTYKALRRPRDPVYNNLRTPLASIASALSDLCGDER